MSIPGLTLNNQPVQLGEVVTRLSIEERVNLTKTVDTSLEKDLHIILSTTKKCATCTICKEFLYKSGYANTVVLLTNERNCGHVFHGGCVSDLLTRTPKCPICGIDGVFMCHLHFAV